MKEDDWKSVVEPYLKANGVEYPWKPRDTYAALKQRDALQSRLFKISSLITELECYVEGGGAVVNIMKEIWEVLDG